MPTSAHRVLSGRNLLLLLILGLIWGTAFPFISIALDPVDPSFSPLLFAAIRFDVAGAALLALVLWRGLCRPQRDASPGAWGRLDFLRPQSRAQWGALAVASTLNIGLYHALLFVGQPLTNAAIAAVIVGLNPVLTTVFARAFLPDERLGAWGLLGLGLGVTGIVLLAALRGGNLLDAQGVGELLVLGAILAFACGSALVRRARHGMDVFAFTAWQMLAGALLLHVSALLFEGGGFARWTPKALLSLLYLALVASSAGFVLYFTLLERIGPIRANLVSHVAPVVATLVVALAPLAGVLIPGPPFEWRALVAFAFIAAGFGLVARPTPAPVARRAAGP